MALGATAGLLGAVCAIWGLAFGCSFPAYTTGDLTAADGGDAGDGGVDTGPVDTGPVDTGPYVLGDGRVCTGPDEDGDGVPDECDNCPNVPNPGLAGHEVGDACDSNLLGGLTTRLAWEPFHTYTPGTIWNYYGPSEGAFALAPDSNSILGGSTSDNPDAGTNLRFITGPVGVGASAGSSGVAVTTVMSIVSEGGSLPNAGLIARVDGATGKQFFLCGVGSVGYFYLLRTATGGSCDGGPCNVNAFGYDGGTANTSELPFPADVPHGIGDKIGIRITVTPGSGDGGTNPGDVECRVFNPLAPSGLRSSEPKYAIKLTVSPSSRWIASGDVGAYASGSNVKFHSMDILKGP